ncbi:uncharacterized protein LOC135464832 [Liolophura sinensis]|uniref:uncharacterized protein LOC135464832 n=1 Tax=Liolophura sinensis TaxID=3198878 RepID=UPI0031585F7E
MKTARCPREVWKEVDKLFNLWRRKEINGQVKDTLKQTQFKIINSVPLPRRVELLKQINQSKISWQDFLDLCKEDIRPNQSSVVSRDLDDVTCPSDTEEEAVVDKPLANPKNRDTSSQLSGQVEDLVSKVKVIEKKWLEAEKRANANESRARELTKKLAAERSVICKLKIMLSKQQQKNLELSKRVKLSETETEDNKAQINRLQQQLCVLSYQEVHQGGSVESLAQQKKIHADELRLKSLELAAKDKEIEMLKVQKNAQLRICEAELAFKSALLEAREKEIELQRLKAEHSNLQKSRKRKSLEQEAILPFSVRIHSAKKVDGNHVNKERATDASEPSQRGNKSHDADGTQMNQLGDIDCTVNSATTEFWETMIEDTEMSTCPSPYPVSVKRIKAEPQE